MGVSSPQLLKFREPRTNVTVVLVGAMHYNPTSVRLAGDTVEALGESNRLGSVVIESCDIRWNKTGELYEESPVLKKFLSSEMRTACDAATKFNRPVVLGDQRINITSTAIKDGLKQTFADLSNPISGWKRFFTQVSEAVELALPTGPGYLNAFGFFELRLLLAAPVSFIKYPLAFLSRSPLFAAFFLTLLTSSAIDPASLDGSTVVTENIGTKDILLSLGISTLETVVFFRLLIKELLAERNEILARSIFQQCLLYSKNTTNKQIGNWNFFGIKFPDFASLALDSKSPKSEIVYAEDNMEKIGTQVNFFGGDSNENDKVVVAVLGMAHCNGIKKLLKEELI